MQSYKGRFEPTRFEDLTVTVDFHCHSACRFCIVHEGMNYFRGVPFAKYTEAVDDNVASKRYRRVTFTGGEVTMEDSLLAYSEYARDSGSFEHIRLQTNGRLLKERAFVDKLIEVGIDEYFVSVHGHNAELQDFIAQRPGGFDETIAGLENLQAAGQLIMTNTVLTKDNVHALSDLVRTVARFKPARMEFWNYLPMEDYEDTRALIVPMEELAPKLVEALGTARDLGIACAVKYVPQCLLGEFADCMDNAQPDVVIVEDFYEIYPQFACLYEATCEYSETCLGLHHPYISKHGWEEHQLVPVPRTTPWREPEYGLALESDSPDGTRSQGPELSPWQSLIEGIPEKHGARVVDIMVQRRSCIYRLEVGDGASVDFVLTARDDNEPALLRTRSFNIHYRNLQGDDKKAQAAIIRTLAEVVRDRDTGGHQLDPRKGLIGPESIRRARKPMETNQAPGRDND